MKKIGVLLVALVMAFAVVTGCGQAGNVEETVEKTTGTVSQENVEETVEKTTAESTEETKADVTVRLGGLKGPTTMGMVKLLEDNEKDLTANAYDFTMAITADELNPKLLKGELDIAAVPANLGAVLYNNSEGAVQMIAVNTLGVLYIVEKGGEEIQSISDLKGQTIYATGKGATPELSLNYLLSQNGLDPATDVKMEWKSEPTEVVAQMATEEHAVAMIPQPFVTVAETQLEDLRVALDLNEEWNNLGTDSKFLTSGLVVRKAFAEEHPDLVENFLEDYANSVTYVNENVEDAAGLVEKYDIVKAPIAKKAIPYCNIVCITGDEMKTMVQGYFEVLNAENPKTIGGKLPGEDFYWVNE